MLSSTWGLLRGLAAPHMTCCDPTCQTPHAFFAVQTPSPQNSIPAPHRLTLCHAYQPICLAASADQALQLDLHFKTAGFNNIGFAIYENTEAFEEVAVTADCGGAAAEAGHCVVGTEALVAYNELLHNVYTGASDAKDMTEWVETNRFLQVTGRVPSRRTGPCHPASDLAVE